MVHFEAVNLKVVFLHIKINLETQSLLFLISLKRNLTFFYFKPEKPNSSAGLS
jgi:hypothetical protein